MARFNATALIYLAVVAYQDLLTDLNSQRYLTKLFDDALLLATRPHQPLALLYIDLDNFKPITDSAGRSVSLSQLSA